MVSSPVTGVVKFASLNCCGFNSKMNNGVFDEYLSDSDIIIVTETNSTFADLASSKLCDYTAYNSSLYNSVLFANSGVFLLVRDRYVKWVKELKGSSKNVLWFKVSKEVFGIDCILGAAYITNESSVYYTNDMFELISNDIISLKAKYSMPFLIMGDFNARTGRLRDFIDRDVVDRVFGYDELNDDVEDMSDNSAIVVDRANMDRGQPNTNGRRLIELCSTNSRRLTSKRGLFEMVGFSDPTSN